MLLFLRQMFMTRVSVCVCVCVYVVVHGHCSAQLSMFNMEKRYRNKIIIIINYKTANFSKMHVREDQCSLSSNTCLYPHSRKFTSHHFHTSPFHFQLSP